MTLTIGQKLDPRRFTAMSGKMTAIVAFLLGKDAVAITEPAITEIAVTSDGLVLAGNTDDPFMNDMIGSVDDLVSNLERLAQAAGLTPEERAQINLALRTKVAFHGHQHAAIAAR